MKIFLTLLAIAAFAQAACVSATSAHIMAGDLKNAAPPFGLLDPATPILPAPLPGSPKILKARELAGILERSGIDVDPGTPMEELCIERMVRPISSSELKAALDAALGLAEASIELLEFSSQSFPPGRFEFHRENLNRPAQGVPLGAVIWRGKLIYDEQHSSPVWAKVRISVERASFIAAQNISAGTVIATEQVQTISGREFPQWTPAALSELRIIGKSARRNIVSGERFAPGLLEEPVDIQKGDAVHVQVVDGSALLSLEGVARSRGRTGDTIVVHNPSNGRNFRAVVIKKGEVAIRLSRGA